MLEQLRFIEYNKGKTYGSRVEFIDNNTKIKIKIHKLHPTNNLKPYQIEIILEELKKWEELNKEPYKKYEGSFNVRIEPELHRRATLFAESFNISLNQFVAKAICDEIEACESKRGK